MPHRKGEEAEIIRECFRGIMVRIGNFEKELVDGKLQDVLTIGQEKYVVTRYLPKILMESIDQLPIGDITIEFLVQFLRLAGENPIFKNSDSIVIPSEIIDFFESLTLSFHKEKHYRGLLDNAISNHEIAETALDSIKKMKNAGSKTLENLKDEMATLSAELDSAKEFRTELQRKLEALRTFILSSETMRLVFGDAFVSPMNSSLPTISDLEISLSIHEDKMKVLQQRIEQLSEQISNSERSIRKIHTDLMNAETAKNEAVIEIEKIKRNIWREKFYLSPRE